MKGSEARTAAGNWAGESDGLYRLLVESVRDYAIFALDPKGYILSWNSGAERFKGYTAGEIIGKHFSVFYPEEDSAKPAYELEIAEHEGRYEEEGWRIRKDGSRFWANVVITALRDRVGTLVGFAKVTRDLTERREAIQREIESAKRVALSEDANRAKASFLAAMSHELRTPLNAISGYADLLLMNVGGGLSTLQCDYLERIRTSQKHLLSIINDILNFSRVEAGHVAYTLAPMSLRSVAASVLPMIEPQARTRGVALALVPSADVTACGDQVKVEQILLNLLSNAVKFTPEGGRVDVAWSRDGDDARLTVTDTGVGMSESDLTTIFQPFVQLGRSLTSTHEGTGLGLAISHDMAKGMGGSLSVVSAEGQGSVFTLTLPAKRAQEVHSA